MPEPLEPIYHALREMMLRSSQAMDATTDEPGNLVVKTRWTEGKKKEPAWFGAVQVKKNYVAYHLMPLYALPALKDGISPELEQRMQGKSCFNFRKMEPELFDPLERLTRICASAYAQPVEAKPH